MAGQRCAQQPYGDARARGFAKPHVEIEQRVEAEFAQQHAVTRIDRLETGWRVVAVNQRS
jgi:hypothetical protein